MTWNIRLGIESSLKAVGDAVLAAGVPDVLALQEVGVDWNMGEKVDQPRVLAQRIGLPHHLFVGAITDKAGGRFGIALLCRWPFTAADVTLLPRDTDEQRVLLRARIFVPAPGLNGRQQASPVSLLNTHLSRKPTKERLEQAAVVGAAAAVAAVEGPVVLLGDLNDDPGTATLKAAGGKLVDCFAAAGKGPPETFSVKDPKQRIDYVFCGGGLQPTGAVRVVREALASDHFPLTAEVGPPPAATQGPPAKP
jgi:endonuclease/exonuclease/phosphatase family metal-dependent hydrolase